MKIGIIDADLIGREKHRFPNLACEKISGYWKETGADVELLMNYDTLDMYDHVYISKVFTDTPTPIWLTETERVHLGGTGFFFDKSPALPEFIEHHFPDYHLYDNWISEEIKQAEEKYKFHQKIFNKKKFLSQFKYYTDYSIGFLTRGCFRKCKFCVNQNYNKVSVHSPLLEFDSSDRKKICLLDDNFFGYEKWETLLQQLIKSDKPFQFKQGLDERLLTDKKCDLLFSSKYDGDYIFAFDNVKDYDLIQQKLKMIRRHTNSTQIKFYILVGFDNTDVDDIESTFKRISLLMNFQCIPYIMRYQSKSYAPWKFSKYNGMYIALARWCNQPSIFKKMSFREFCCADQKTIKTPGRYCSSMKALIEFEQENPNIARNYFDIKFNA